MYRAVTTTSAAVDMRGYTTISGSSPLLNTSKDTSRFRGMRRRVDPDTVIRETKMRVRKPALVLMNRNGASTITEARREADTPVEIISQSLSFPLLQLGSTIPMFREEVNLPTIEPAIAPLAPMSGG